MFPTAPTCSVDALAFYLGSLRLADTPARFIHLALLLGGPPRSDSSRSRAQAYWKPA